MTSIPLKYNLTVFLKSCVCSAIFTFIFILLVKIFEVKVFITNIPLICITALFVFFSGLFSSLVSIYGVYGKFQSQIKKTDNNIIIDTIDQPLQDVKTFNTKLKNISQEKHNKPSTHENNNLPISHVNSNDNGSQKIISSDSTSTQENDANISLKLRILNLPINILENSIKQFFNNYKITINKISIIKNDKKKKNAYAIIEFTSSKTDKNKLLQELNKLNYAGKKLSAKYI